MDNIRKDVEFEEIWTHLKQTETPIVIFGCMALGRIAKKTVEFFGKKILCFCDNDPKKQGTSVDGFCVISPQKLKEIYPNAEVIVCSFHEKTTIEICIQLSGLGFHKLYDSDIVLWAYQVYVMERPVAPDILENKIRLLRKMDRNSVILKNVLIYITEKCTLRCKDCSAFVQYVHNPVNYDKDIIIQSMNTLSKAVDVIEYFTILGGEPLLHPDVADICQEAAKLQNVLMIRFVTNGTVIPKKHFLDIAKSSLFYSDISDYGDLSANKYKVQECFHAHNTLCEIYGNDVQWYEIFKPQKFQRSEQENVERFKNCTWRNETAILQNGEFHLCGYSANGKMLNFFTPEGDEYVDIKSENHLDAIHGIKSLLKKRTSLTACDYCDVKNALCIPAKRATQIKEPLTYCGIGQ